MICKPDIEINVVAASEDVKSIMNRVNQKIYNSLSTWFCCTCTLCVVFFSELSSHAFAVLLQNDPKQEKALYRRLSKRPKYRNVSMPKDDSVHASFL